MINTIQRGEIYYVDLSPVVGSEQGGVRLVLILQNDTGNKFSSTTIIAPITSVPQKKSQPTHIFIDCDFLESESVVLLDQLRTIDKKRLSDRLGQLSPKAYYYRPASQGAGFHFVQAYCPCRFCGPLKGVCITCYP